MRRLADGRDVEVPAQQVAQVTLDTSEGIEPRERLQPVSERRMDFEHKPRGFWTGTWRAPEPGQPGRLAAEPYVARRKTDGGLTIRHGVRATLESDLQGAPLIISTNSMLTFRWRTARTAAVLVMVGCAHPEDRRFGGNYQYQFRLPSTPPDAAGWRVTRCPLADFNANVQNDLGTSFLLVSRIVVSASFAADGLEVAELKLEARERTE